MADKQALKLFYSYSHRDEALREKLETHLALLRRQGVIAEWHDRKIEAGSEWAGDISGHLESADVILLLVSADFLASDYCFEIEMKRALERHEAGQALVIPVILRPCDWHAAPIGRLQALPRDAKPITTWNDQDEAFSEVVRALRSVVLRPPQPPSGPVVGSESATVPNSEALSAGQESPQSPAPSRPGRPVTTTSNRSISIGGNATDNVIVTGDHNRASLNFTQTTLPPADEVDSRSEFAVLRKALGRVSSPDQKKIDRALEDAGDELDKPTPDRDEIGDALDRALKYAAKSEEFPAVINELRTPLGRLVAWLGAQWTSLLEHVGMRT